MTIAILAHDSRKENALSRENFAFLTYKNTIVLLLHCEKRQNLGYISPSKRIHFLRKVKYFSLFSLESKYSPSR